MRQPVDAGQRYAIFHRPAAAHRRIDNYIPFMKLLRFLILVSLVAFASPIAHATTVIPPTFDELVTRAEMIFEGTVTSMHSEWTGEGSNRHIVTFVTLKIEDSIKGGGGSEYTIRLLGG